MSGTRRSLFIVAPDANAATLKKLRGVGIATGTNIVAVQNTSELPLPPHDTSTLLIPDYLIDQGYSTNQWHRVFEVAYSPKVANSRLRNVITSNKSYSFGPDWSQILNQFIHHFIEEQSHTRWYAIKAMFVTRSELLTTQMTSWMNSHHIKKTAKLSALLNSLDVLSKLSPFGDGNHQNCNLHIILDTQHLEIKVNMPCQNHFDVERLHNSFTGMGALLTSFTKTVDDLIVKIQIPLIGTAETSLIVFIQHQQPASVEAHPEKDAS